MSTRNPKNLILMSTDEITGQSLVTSLDSLSGQEMVVFAPAPPSPSSDGGDDGYDDAFNHVDMVQKITTPPPSRDGDTPSPPPEDWEPLTGLV